MKPAPLLCFEQFNRNGTKYLYELNGQGDVTGILDTTGKQIVSYTYDAWGKCTIASDTSGKNIGSINPMRYRGYYLDKETGFFYVGSRYYDPNTCRFLNADETEILKLAVESDSILGVNLFAYCMNNPIMYSNSTGMWLDRLICGVIVAVLGPSFMVKNTPNLLKAIKQIEKT